MELRRREEQFVALVSAIFQAHGYRHEPPPVDSGWDLIVTKGNRRIGLELKAYSSRFIPLSLLLAAVHQVRRLRSTTNVTAALIVTNSAVSASVAELLDVTPDVGVVGFNLLAELARTNPELLVQLDAFSSALTGAASDGSSASTASRDEAAFDGSRTGPVEALERLISRSAQGQTSATDGDARGALLCAQLRRIPTGKNATVRDGAGKVAASRHFEKTCAEALRYLFENDLTRWDEADQYKSHSGASRFDLILKIVSEKQFWRMLVEDFRTRYVIFEFKHYREPIRQTQIYTTEKYLNVAAMRSSAIIISREGPDKNALSASRGALREAGKIILHLDLDDMCKMLQLRDEGGDASQHLEDVLDRHLMGFER